MVPVAVAIVAKMRSTALKTSAATEPAQAGLIVKKILCPLPHIACHIVQPKVIWGKGVNGTALPVSNQFALTVLVDIRDDRMENPDLPSQITRFPGTLILHEYVRGIGPAGAEAE